MHIKSTRDRLLATTMICGAAMALAAPAFAQDAAVQEVVVTGSRIPQPNLTAVSPVTAVTSAEIKLEGTTRVEDLLNNLPQVFASQGSTVSNGFERYGHSRSSRSGRQSHPRTDRRQARSPRRPRRTRRRLELYSGPVDRPRRSRHRRRFGVYGSDAVSGVVNFIMKKNFSGVQLDAQYSFYQHDNDDDFLQGLNKSKGFAYPSGGITDGYQTSVSAIMGVNAPDGKGNLTAYATYRSARAVLEADRDYTACTLGETGSTFACGGSSTASPPRLYLVAGAPGATGTNGTSYTTVGTGAATTLRNYSTATDAFNYGPYNYLQRRTPATPPALTGTMKSAPWLTFTPRSCSWMMIPRTDRAGRHLLRHKLQCAL